MTGYRHTEIIMTICHCKLYYFDMCKLHQTYYFGFILTMLYTFKQLNS